MIKLLQNKRFRLIFGLLIASVILCTMAFLIYTEEPVLSHKSGFYEEPFELEITAYPTTRIYYTLDGTRPTKDSLKYTGPITITNATPNPNNYSAIEDVGVFFHPGFTEYYNYSTEYKIPDFPVDKCTVVRAVAISPGGEESEIVSASYFVEQSPEDYGCPVISMVTDPENLFDRKTGIYVGGALLQSQYDWYGFEESWWWSDANYTQRGADWERPVLLEFFDETGTLVQDKDAGVRIRGNYSRAFLPRSLSLFARTEYDKSETFGQDFFNAGYEQETIALSSGGNQTTTLIPDVMMTELTKNLNFATAKYAPYVLFINGEYWGFYWMMEKFDDSYVSHYFNVDKDNVIVIKNNQLQEGEPTDIQYYKDLTEFFEETDLSKEENFREACELVDIDSFIDYYATMIYIARTEDWPRENVALWRARQPEANSDYSDGKWRWMLFDCNSLCMQHDRQLTTHNTLNYVIEEDSLFRSMWNNETFQEMFRDRILEIGSTNFMHGNVEYFLNTYTEQVKPLLRKSWARFYGQENNQEQYYNDMVYSHSLFFYYRYAEVAAWFKDK